jgi:hypothetical protein
MGDTITLRGPDGDIVEVPLESAGGLIDRGYRAEQAGERLSRMGEAAKEDTYGGVGGAVGAFTTRALGAATLGLSDAVLSELGGPDAAYALDALRDVNPGAALAGNLAGAVLPGMGAGKLAGLLPGGAASRAARSIVTAGEEAGFLGRAAYTAAGTAVEGGLQNAGAYITDVALGDRELSAEGFAGAMGHGAFWGGAAGGALTLAAGGLTAARRLFPKAEMTAENVARVERQAADDIGRAVDDGATLERAGRDRIDEIATERAITDPDFAARIRAAREREFAARADTAEAKAATAEERAWQAKQKAADVRDGVKPPRRARKAMEEGGEAPAVEPTTTTGTEPVAPGLAPVAAETATTPMSSLEAQLLATKARIDAGEALANIGAKPASIDVALEVAKVDPEAAKIVQALDEMNASRTVLDEWLGKYGGRTSNVSKFERSAASREWAESVRPKESGYYTRTPSGEPGSNAIIQRGYSKQWRGSEAERVAAEERINAKVNPVERDSIDAMFSKRTADDVADEVVAPSVDERVSGAIKRRVDDIDADIAETAPAITRYESASADLSEVLGPRAPVSAQDRAAAFREAQGTAEARVTQAAGDAAGDIERATSMVSLPAAQQLPRGAGALDKVQTGGDLWQALHMMGVPLPDPRDVPVVGPLLSMYLKARVLGKAFGRFGGKVAETAETVIATKAAATKQRVYSAVDAMLDKGSKAIGNVAPSVGAPAAILAHSLFDGRAVGADVPPTKKGDQASLYHARAAELTAAMQPGAIAESVRARVRPTDPELLGMIVAAKERKLGYLYETMPKADVPPGLLSAEDHWTPNKAELASWTRRIQAAEDPASVLETAAGGGIVTREASETLKAVYPRLYQEAQVRLLAKVADGTAREIPYARRLQLSMLFDLPLDASVRPESAAFLQASYQPAAPASQGAPAPVTPTVASDVRSGGRVDPSAKERRP